MLYEVITGGTVLFWQPFVLILGMCNTGCQQHGKKEQLPYSLPNPHFLLQCFTPVNLARMLSVEDAITK